LVLNKDLFESVIFQNCLRQYSKIRNHSKFDTKINIFEQLSNVEQSVKRGSYIQRYKGLGEMNPNQLWETTMQPENRVLLQIQIDDFENANGTFKLFMGDEVEPRKNYIIANAKNVEFLDI
jgi:DNA gyrase subunit B